MRQSRPREELAQMWTTVEIKKFLKAEKYKQGKSMLQLQEDMLQVYIKSLDNS